MTVYETRQPYSSAQKYLNKPEGKNLCEEFVLYTTYIVLHIATIQKVLIARYFEILFDRWRFTVYRLSGALPSGAQKFLKNTVLFEKYCTFD